MGVADESPEAPRTTALGGMTMTPGEVVIVIDHEQGAERFAADRAESSLSGQGGPYLQLAEALARSRRLPWVSGG